MPSLLHDLASPCHSVWEFFGRIQAGGEWHQRTTAPCCYSPGHPDLGWPPWCSVQTSCWYEFLFYQETAELMWSEGGQGAVNERWLLTVTHMHNAHSFLTFTHTHTLQHKITSELFIGRCHGKELSILNDFFPARTRGHSTDSADQPAG